MLHPSVDLGCDACLLDMLADLVHDILDVFLPLALAHGNFIYKIIIYIRLQIFQRQIIQLDLDLADAKPLGDGAVYLQCLLGNTLPALRRLVLQRAHIVESVRQLDQDHPDILGHGKEHLPQILRLHLQLYVGLVDPRGKGDLLQLSDPVHQQRHVRAEFPDQILLAHDSVLHHIVKNSCNDGLLIQLQLRQYDGHVQGMYDIWLTRLAELILMGISRSIVRFFNH